jgi:hypothetical protein
VNKLDESECVITFQDKELRVIPFNTIFDNIPLLLDKTLSLNVGDEVIQFWIYSHERGYSVKTPFYGCKINISFEGDTQFIEFNKVLEDPNIRVMETKIVFENKDYPFHFKFENNESCDGIFNDFIQEVLPEIKPPKSFVVPVKYTNNIIPFRQYISYIKTRTFLQFKVDKSGWFIDSIEEAENESIDEFPNGVKIKYESFWTYFPRGTRIEHVLVLN